MQSMLIAEHDKKEYRRLTPLTPNTSFTLTSGSGIQQERAFMYNCLCSLDALCKFKEPLKNLMKQSAGKYWDKYVTDYHNKIVKINNGNYYFDMKQKLEEKLQEAANNDIIPKLISYCTELQHNANTSDCAFLINRLRKLFAEISLDQLNPDLVIMDEFQRFRNLIDYQNDTEQSMLVKKFFDINNDNMSVLLMSATPYKPYTTLEELNETNIDEEYSDFFQLMKFLNEGSVTNQDFEKVWENYSSELSQFSKDRLTVLFTKKKEAEEKMYNVMCRTERLDGGVYDSNGANELKIEIGDIVSYCQIQKILLKCQELDRSNNRYSRSYNIPMDYVKSSPYLLSFMEHYKYKHQITETFKGKLKDIFDVVKPRDQRLLLKFNNIYHYRQISPNNARLSQIKEFLFKNHSELLLWVPASHPYYSCPGSIFEKNKDFSKVLVFSAWEMVPRMLSIMLSYEAELLTIGKLGELTYLGTKGRKYRFQTEDAMNLLRTVSPYLASKYDAKQYFGMSIKKIRSEIRKTIKSDLRRLNVPFFNDRSAKSLLDLIKCLDGESVEVKKIPINALDVLVDMAIASPAICMYRIMHNVDYDEKIHDCEAIGDRIVSMFNRKENAAVIYLMYQGKSGEYYEHVFDYCVKGNLQSVLDEYAFILGKSGNELFREMDKGFSVTTPTLDIDTYQSNGKIDKTSMRIHYALSFANVKLTDKDINRAVTVRTSFNSPFRPFVLTTTSIGQEGLDFHWYTRKIMHWNLPSNPVDIEQREGRINRYECLAIRRNIAHRYGSSIFNWDEMFKATSLEFKNEHSDLVPYWCLPKDMEKRMSDDHQPFEKIERIVPIYPLSKDKSLYDRLIKVLSLYRLTLGQPRQEELLMLLNGQLNAEETKQLLINLCPFSKKKR
jgi:hypothetical protein